MGQEHSASEDTRSAIERHQTHYAQDMGRIAESQMDLADVAPGAFDGYAQMRKSIMGPDAVGRLPLKYRHIVVSALDCAVGNLGGAENHAKRAIKAGATSQEVADALVCLVMVCGMPTWGQYGRKAVRAARAAEAGDENLNP